jgi:taurine--2-oxoglutarate transaminase
MPLGAVIVSDAVAKYFETNMLWGGLTYSGHPVSCAAAVANLRIYEEDGIFANVAARGQQLGQRLQAMKRKYRCVGDVRHIGLFSVLELVKDKGTREPLAPFNGSSPEMVKLAAHLKSRHLYAFSRFNMLWVCPPLIINEGELNAGLDIVEEALGTVDAALAPAAAEEAAGVGTVRP